MPRLTIRRSMLAMTVLLLVASSSSAQETQVVFESNVMIPMRDGVELAAHLFRPAEDGPFPVILSRTPYGKGGERNGQARAYVAAQPR